MSTKKRAVLGVLLIAVVLVLFVPGISVAGSLEPPSTAVTSSGTPTATMKTLDQIPPTWSQTLPAAQRFELVLDGAAVLDKETGLVWEQSPGTPAQPWADTVFACQTKSVGNRLGWRLPTIEELASLVDQSVTTFAKLPTGHPFSSNLQAYYWSASVSAANTDNALFVNFYFANVGSNPKNYSGYAWCVRGGQDHDAQ